MLHVDITIQGVNFWRTVLQNRFQNTVILYFVKYD